MLGARVRPTLGIFVLTACRPVVDGPGAVDPLPEGRSAEESVDAAETDPGPTTATETAHTDVPGETDTDAPPLPPPPATWTLGPEVVCADPTARLDRAYDTWSPGGAWDAQPYDPEALALYAGGGVAVADLDADGVIDVFRTSADGGFRWLALAPGGAVDRTAELPPLPASTSAVIVVDADGDGDLDLHVLGWRAPDVLALQGPQGFTDVAADWGLAGPPDEDTVGASWGDADGDGDLDLYVAVYGPVLGDATPDHLWLRGDDGTFTDLVVPLPADHFLKVAHPFVGAWVDLVGDRRPELYVVRDFGGRRASGAYAVEAGAVVDVPDLGVELRTDGMGLGIGDLDDDGVDDFVVPETLGIDVLISEGGRWYEGSTALGIVQDRDRGQDLGWGAEVVDLDLDGAEEVVVAWGHLSPESGFARSAEREADAVWRFDGRIYLDVAQSWGLAQQGVGRGFVVTDVSGDGWPDLVKQDLRGPTTIHRARCGEARWLTVGLTQDGPNTLGVGAEVRVEAGGTVWRRTVRAGGTSYASGGPPEVQIGVGALTQVDRVVVRWPDGTEDTLADVPTARRVSVDRRRP